MSTLLFNIGFPHVRWNLPAVCITADPPPADVLDWTFHFTRFPILLTEYSTASYFQYNRLPAPRASVKQYEILLVRGCGRGHHRSRNGQAIRAQQTPTAAFGEATTVSTGRTDRCSGQRRPHFRYCLSLLIVCVCMTAERLIGGIYMKAARTRNWTYKTPTISARKRPTTAWSPTSSGASPTPRTGFSREDGCANKS